MQGIKSRHRKKAEKMKPGDRIVWYLTGVKAFGGVATITSTYFEAHDRIWQSGDPKKETEDYPFRFNISPDIVLDDFDLKRADLDLYKSSLRPYDRRILARVNSLAEEITSQM